MRSRENIAHSATNDNRSLVLNYQCVEIARYLIRREYFGTHNYYEAK